jgi:hypothetical protein
VAMPRSLKLSAVARCWVCRGHSRRFLSLTQSAVADAANSSVQFSTSCHSD